PRSSAEAHLEKMKKSEPWTELIIFILGLGLGLGTSWGSENSHQPQNVTWVVLDSHSDIVNWTSEKRPPNTWFPELQFDLGRVLLSTNDDDFIKKHHFYVCPGHKTERSYKMTCGGADQFYCAAWSCVSMGHIWWDPLFKGDLIQVTRVTQSLPCKRERKDGVTWGVRLYEKVRLGYQDEENLFTIKMIQSTLETLAAIGPNPVLRENSPREIEGTTRPTDRTSAIPEEPRRLANLIWVLMNASFGIINASNPNLINSCWFCYKPPYYEGLGMVAEYNVSESDQGCRWKKGSQTLQSITGQGVCIGKVPKKYQQYCNSTNSTIQEKQYYIPPMGGWWACNMGLTACAYGKIINQAGFCILVQILPRIYFHSESEMYQLYEQGGRLRVKREPISTFTIALLVGLGATGAGTGISSITKQYSQYNYLRQAIDEDLERIETSMSHLQKSLTSLSEVVLQNRRGLDLLFLQEGGLCVALREECCFYADHSGIVQDSEKTEGRTEPKKKRKGYHQGWFESLFNTSPWMTTLISTLIGPLILLLLILTFGPCILNKLINFMKDRIDTVQMMVLRQQYDPLAEACYLPPPLPFCSQEAC
uniref:Envelope protein n=1 Tax=Pseudonaja textilis TaxID=8673 RepID=A0A670YKN9_PSETE